MSDEKVEKVNRDKVIIFRATEDEKRKIEANAAQAGLDTSEFLRQLGLEKELKAPLSAEERRLLVGIANNLNQVARRANSGHETGQWLPLLQSLLARLDEFFV